MMTEKTRLCHQVQTEPKFENTLIEDKLNSVHSKGPFALGDMTQIFDVVSMSSEMGCIVTNVTVRT